MWIKPTKPTPNNWLLLLREKSRLLHNNNQFQEVVSTSQEEEIAVQERNEQEYFSEGKSDSWNLGSKEPKAPHGPLTQFPSSNLTANIELACGVQFWAQRLAHSLLLLYLNNDEGSLHRWLWPVLLWWLWLEKSFLASSGREDASFPLPLEDCFCALHNYL